MTKNRPKAESGRVLLVEDDPDTRFLMQTLLEDRCELTLASSPDEALQVAQARSHDLVLLDIDLGEDEKNGEDVLHRLRALPAYQDVPIAALTAYALPGDRKSFMKAGFTAYLSKPFTADDVLAFISDLLPPEHRLV